MNTSGVHSFLMFTSSIRICAIALFAWVTSAEALDLKGARISTAGALTLSERKAIEMLALEVEARTGLNWRTATGDGPSVLIRHFKGSGPAEGYRLSTRAGHVEIQGNDERGTLFGIGRFLRALHWARWTADVADDLDISSAPKYPLRGHQIGYRPKVNSYDAWTPAIFEQYVRDLAVFGTNAIELIPPRSDDVDDSPHFPLPKLDMMVQMSRIVGEYGMEVWIWFPALDKDYSNPKTVDFALQQWAEVFRRLPRIDAVFVPGGDPGSTPPKLLMELLEKQAKSLRQTHPKAQMWVSPQGFDSKGLDEFLAILNTHPAWLNGVVHGPGLRATLPELRAIVPRQYPIRNYPDITHSIHSQFPVPHWDTAYAVTEAREIINPRPVDHTKIFRLNSPSSNGFITYSEGVNDDVNKILWSGLGWDPDADPAAILREFGRYFISADYADSIAQTLFALEQDWRGPLLTNHGVDNTLQQIRELERAATPQMMLNWRFQQILYRGYYDAYIRQRLIYETSLEQQALTRLRQANEGDAHAAIDRAVSILDDAVNKPPSGDLRMRVFTLAEALYQSIRMQLSVDKYKGVAVSRGANLDTLDFPLNNRFWLKNELALISAKSNGDETMKGIQGILNRTSPGPGGYYDDLGDASMQSHLVEEGPGYDKDPSNRYSVQDSWASFSGGLVGRASRDAIRPDGPAAFMQTPYSWWNYAETQYETPITLRYEHLDEKAHYAVRVVYVSEARSPKVRLVANKGIEVHPFRARPFPMAPLEFDIPLEATRGGTLTLRWTTEPGLGGFTTLGIAEVFLLRK